jgi:hypothetical protein
VRAWLVVGCLLGLASLAHAQAQEEDLDPPPAEPSAAPPSVEAPPPVAPPPNAPPIAPNPPMIEGAPPLVVDGQVVVDRRRKRNPGHGYFNLLALGAYRHFFDEELGAANVDFEVGGETKDRTFSVGGRASILAGASKVGLPFEHFAFGAVAHAQITDRFQIGIGAQFGVLVLNRALRKTDDPWSPTIGGYLEPTFDLWKDAQHHRLFVVARMGYDYIADTGRDSPNCITVQLGVGYRF